MPSSPNPTSIIEAGSGTGVTAAVVVCAPDRTAPNSVSERFFERVKIGRQRKVEAAVGEHNRLPRGVHVDEKRPPATRRRPVIVVDQTGMELPVGTVNTICRVSGSGGWRSTRWCFPASASRARGSARRRTVGDDVERGRRKRQVIRGVKGRARRRR